MLYELVPVVTNLGLKI